MINFYYNKLQNFLLIFLLFLNTNYSRSQEKNYLDTVIERINSLEIELKSIQSNNPDNLGNEDRYTNFIAVHEQRLSELEEEIRNLREPNNEHCIPSDPQTTYKNPTLKLKWRKERQISPGPKGYVRTTQRVG